MGLTWDASIFVSVTSAAANNHSIFATTTITAHVFLSVVGLAGSDIDIAHTI